jgi:cysteine desulfurase / selenocysteine lyase
MTNWEDIRKQFPVTTNLAYLNTAAAGPLARSTAAAGQKYYQQMVEDGDAHWDEWLEQREGIRRRVAEFINAEPDEIAFTTNTSSGMNIIIDALETRGEVISCDLEFPVSTIPWMHRRIPVHLAKARDGVVHIEDILKLKNEKTGVISLSHVQFSNGFRMNLQELSENKGDHVLVVNASQSAGVFEIDVKRMGIDALCTTGHKWLLSGYGSGFVYLSRELLAQTKSHAIGWLSVNEPYAMRNDEIHLRHDAAARAELGCPHFAGIFAMGNSMVQLTSIGIQRIQERALELNRYLTERLAGIGWKVLSPLGKEEVRSPQTLVEAEDPASLVTHLASFGVAVTEKPQGIRVATNFFNNEDDVERLIDGLKDYGKKD